MIGNDIVDLNLAEIQSNWQREGFLEKQFTKKEQEQIRGSKDPFLKVWLFWSMKEAAYKCYTQTNEKRFFAPQKFECTLTEEEEGIVTFEENKFYTSTHFSTFYIHTLAEDILVEDNDTIRVFSGIGSLKTVDKDIKLRLAEKTGVLSEEIVQRKSSVGAPLYFHQEKLLTSSCSISHHGNYGAFAFTLENES
ncbi:MAG: 4'-phosphopantetheinyl transferase superfamily protein [Polaribacter sp.]|uniref:4'-phosphopantetheinyl transferase family protein n=1 Tax=Polaribacter sp. TaxID=1920175 RepID=UPI002F354060